MIAKIGMIVGLCIFQSAALAAMSFMQGDVHGTFSSDGQEITAKAQPLAGMNAGLNDAWFNAGTSGQGFFITVFPGMGYVSLAWFTYDTARPEGNVTANLGEPGHRWLNALGAYSGNRAVMNITRTSGGLFDMPTEITKVDDGTIVLTFEDCKNGTVAYDIPSIDKRGVVPIKRVAEDNIELCELLNSATTHCDVRAPNLACDLLAYWRFEEPVYFGRKHGVMDYSLTSHPATPVNAVHHTTTGKLGKALAFNGTSEYLTADHQALKTLQNGSVSIWFKTTANIHPHTNQSLLQSGSEAQVKLDIDEMGHIGFTLDTDITSYTLLSGAGHNDGKWHHAVATWGNNDLALFVDGQQVASNPDIATRPITLEAWHIGTTNADHDGLFKGSLDEAAIWKRQLTSAEVQSLYNSGNGRVISMGPVIDQFQPRKMIYQPSDLVIFDLAIDSDQTYSNAKIEVWVEREVNTKVHVYRQTHQITQGAQKFEIKWPLSGNGLNNNVQGHLARVTVRDANGQIIAEKEALFDVVDDWWKVMRLATIGASTIASPGPPSTVGRLSDASIQDKVESIRNSGFNTFEVFHYAPPWNLDPEGDRWEDIDVAGRFIARDRILQWGRALHSRGMKYLAYNETASIRGPPEWQARWKDDGKVWQHYYADKGYFVPNLNFLSQRWANENKAAINAFDFDGILMDSAYAVGKNTVMYTNDNEGNPLPQYPSVGQYMHDGIGGMVKTAIRARKDTYAYVSQNAYPLVYYALNYPLDDIYDKVLATANLQDVWPYSSDVDVWSIEWDSVNTPSDRYPQEYERMAVIMTSLVDVLGKQVLQWAFLTSKSTSDIAYIRPKMATYLAARLKVHDHHNFYEGLMSDARNEADSQQMAQYLRFQARYSYYLDHADLKLIQQPQNTHFDLSASKDLFWNRTVYHRLDNGKNEYIIHALNLPSNGKIEEQTEIPPTAEDVILSIRKSIGNFEVFCLDADDATLIPIEVNMDSQDASYRYFRLPPVRSWQVLVLKEK